MDRRWYLAWYRNSWTPVVTSFLMQGSLAARSLVEGLATGLLAFTISSTVHQSVSAFERVLIVGLVLATLIHLCGRITGAHFNPLVSLMLNRQRLGWHTRAYWTESLIYSVAQIAGAVLGYQIDAPVDSDIAFTADAFVPEPVSYTHLTLPTICSV